MINDKRAWLISAINAMTSRNRSNQIYELPDDTLLTSLDLDSLDIVELQMDYEDDTGETLEDSKIPVTVGDLLGMMK